MVNNDISGHILTIGCDYKTTRGGISSVIDSYSHIFSPFNFVATTQTKSKLHNLLYLICSLVKFTFKCFSPEIMVVHIHTASNASFKRKAIYIRIASLFKKKIVLHIHGGKFHLYYENNKTFVKKNLDKVDCLIVLSKQWKEFFEVTVGCKNVVIVPNIVEDATKVSIQNIDNTIKGIFLGQMTQGKGIFDIIEMVAEHKEYLKGKLKLHIGGNGETEKVQYLIKNNEVEDIIKFEGWVNKEMRNDLLSKATFFLLPSYNEGLPISILEAMSFSLPIISTPVGGIPEILTDDCNGFLVEPGDKEALFQAIKKIIEGDCNIEQMGKESFKRVQPHLPENVINSLVKIYQQLL